MSAVCCLVRLHLPQGCQVARKYWGRGSPHIGCPSAACAAAGLTRASAPSAGFFLFAVQPFKLGDRVAVTYATPLSAGGAQPSSWFEGTCEKVDLRCAFQGFSRASPGLGGECLRWETTGLSRDLRNG